MSNIPARDQTFLEHRRTADHAEARACARGERMRDLACRVASKLLQWAMAELETERAAHEETKRLLDIQRACHADADRQAQEAGHDRDRLRSTLTARERELAEVKGELAIAWEDDDVDRQLAETRAKLAEAERELASLRAADLADAGCGSRRPAEVIRELREQLSAMTKDRDFYVREALEVGKDRDRLRAEVAELDGDCNLVAGILAGRTKDHAENIRNAVTKLAREKQQLAAEVAEVRASHARCKAVPILPTDPEDERIVKELIARKRAERAAMAEDKPSPSPDGTARRTSAPYSAPLPSDWGQQPADGARMPEPDSYNTEYYCEPASGQEEESHG